MLNAVASPSRGISSVVFQTSPAGAGTWTTACTGAARPYSCTLGHDRVADGLRDVRAVATDSAGYTQTDTVTQPPRRQHRRHRHDHRSRARR